MHDAFTGGPAAEADEAQFDAGPPPGAWLTLEPSDLHPEGGAWMDRAAARGWTPEPEPQGEAEAEP